MAAVDLDQSSRLDITCRRGDTFNMSLTLKDSNNVAIDFEANTYSFLMQVKGRKGADGIRPTILDTNSAANPADGDGFQFTANTNDGNVSITVPADEMRAVEPGSYTYDLQYIDPDGNHVTILFGAFIINGDIAISS